MKTVFSLLRVAVPHQRHALLEEERLLSLGLFLRQQRLLDAIDRREADFRMSEGRPNKEGKRTKPMRTSKLGAPG
jgi:hypothetical protein